MPQFLGEVFQPMPCSTALSQSEKSGIKTLILIFKHQREALAKEQLEITHKETLFHVGLGSTCAVWVHTETWDCEYER